jgi:hypothetical protein
MNRNSDNNLESLCMLKNFRLYKNLGAASSMRTQQYLNFGNTKHNYFSQRH